MGAPILTSEALASRGAVFPGFQIEQIMEWGSEATLMCSWEGPSGEEGLPLPLQSSANKR